MAGNIAAQSKIINPSSDEIFPFFQHKIVIAGNHELSFDPLTMDECRFYMDQVGEKENLNKAINCSVKRSAPFQTSYQTGSYI